MQLAVIPFSDHDKDKLALELLGVLVLWGASRESTLDIVGRMIVLADDPGEWEAVKSVSLEMFTGLEGARTNADN